MLVALDKHRLKKLGGTLFLLSLNTKFVSWRSMENIEVRELKTLPLCIAMDLL
jgi:hypothetical protein